MRPFEPLPIPCHTAGGCARGPRLGPHIERRMTGQAMARSSLRVLVVTAMYPHPGNVAEGVFVENQMESLALVAPGIQVDVLYLQGPGRLRYPLGAARVLSATHRVRYSLVHAHYGLAALPAIFRCRAPLVVSLHGSDVHVPGQRLLSRLACHFAREVIVQSAEMHRLLGIGRARVIPVGVDLRMFREMDRVRCRQALGLPLPDRIVLFPSDPRRPEKRFDLFRQAIDLLKGRGQSVQVLTLPSGRYPYEQMPQVLNACDVMALTSASEGSPMVVKEAMACNLPIVSVPVGDVVEVIGDTEGCAIADRTPGDIAAKVMLALAREARTDGRQHIRHLDRVAIAGRILQLYERSLAI